MDKPTPMDNKDKYELKNFRSFVILNFKTGAMRIMKKSPGKVGPFEIPIELSFNVTVPKKAEVLMKADIEIPSTKVSEMAAHMV